MIAATAKPRLADKARLRLDPKTGETLLLYPEAGLKLNRTGTHVLERCTGKAVEYGAAVRAAQEAYARGLSGKRQLVGV